MAPSESSPDRLKMAAAEAAVAQIEDGMIVGLGTGSTSKLAVDVVGARVAQGLKIAGIPTSERTAEQARRLGIPLTNFAEHDRLDLAIDGADEVQLGPLHLIKGLGGALLREKIVVGSSSRFIVIVDEGKLVERLGVRTPVPVEVAQFGYQVTARKLRELGGNPNLRQAPDGKPYITDGGNFILDTKFDGIADAVALARQIDAVVGVMEHGLFVGMTSQVIVGAAGGVKILNPSR